MKIYRPRRRERYNKRINTYIRLEEQLYNIFINPRVFCLRWISIYIFIISTYRVALNTIYNNIVCYPRVDLIKWRNPNFASILPPFYDRITLGYHSKIIFFFTNTIFVANVRIRTRILGTTLVRTKQCVRSYLVRYALNPLRILLICIIQSVFGKLERQS